MCSASALSSAKTWSFPTKPHGMSAKFHARGLSRGITIYRGPVRSTSILRLRGTTVSHPHYSLAGQPCCLLDDKHATPFEVDKAAFREKKKAVRSTEYIDRKIINMIAPRHQETIPFGNVIIPSWPREVSYSKHFCNDKRYCFSQCGIAVMCASYIAPPCCHP